MNLAARIFVGATISFQVFGLVVSCATKSESDAKRRSGAAGESSAGGSTADFDASDEGINIGFAGRESGGASGAAGSAGAPPSALDASVEEFCSGTGSAVRIPTASGDACSGDIASQAFRFALCSCTDLSWSSILKTDSFNSSTGATGQNASVGVNQGADGTGTHDIGGSLWIGASGLSLTGSGKVAKDLRVAGGIDSTSPHTISGNLFSDAEVGSYVTVDGAVHVPSGTTLKAVTAKGGIVNEPVTIGEPCDCKTPPLDAASVVDFLANANDNEQSQIAAADLTNFHTAKTLELACGRYYFDEITGSSTLTFKLKGRTVIAVGGKLATSGTFEFEFEEGAELDLFVKGDVEFTGASRFGDLDKPARIRVYVAGTQVTFPGGMLLGGNIYAPHAKLTASGNLDMSGALFANEFSFSGEIKVHYDEAIQEVPGCGPPTTTTCSDCTDCNGSAPACKEGQCTACSSDGDCCPPLVCNQGACVLAPTIK